jgi:hypothetical protein
VSLVGFFCIDLLVYGQKKMVFPGERKLKRRIMRRVLRERFLNLLRRLVGKKPKEYNWEVPDDSD